MPGVLRLPQTRLKPNPKRVREPDLTREFRQFMDESGSHVLYIRRDTNVHCSCWDPVAKQPEGTTFCSECYGTGFRIQIERHLARYMAESTPGRLANAYEQFDPGRIYSSIRSIFFKPGARVKVGDIIFRVEWNQANRRPMNLIQILEIKDVDDARQEQGIAAFYKAYCETIFINKHSVEQQLREETRIMVVD